MSSGSEPFVKISKWGRGGIRGGVGRPGGDYIQTIILLIL